jgi:lipopolysaccharide transport system ATP-binding protein
MNQPAAPYEIRYRFDEAPPAQASGVILDDFFPNLRTGFRVAEYNALLAKFPSLSVHSTSGQFRRHLHNYSQLYPEFALRVKKFSSADLRGSISFAYLNFINNAFDFLRFMEKRKIPFVFTLYPGGGFGIDARESDTKLDCVCASPMLKHVIVTQKLTADYLHARHPAVPSTLIFGCVVNPVYFSELSAPRSWFGEGKASFDVCFVAEKYMDHGWSKGYPVFIDASRRLAEIISETRLHVVGRYTPEDWPIGKLGERLTFHDRLTTQELREFYRSMDVIVSPNIPFVMHPGHFDGFPTGACAEASLCGVAMVVSDVLGMNTEYDPERELIIAKPEAEALTAALVELGRDPARLRALALAGQEKSRALYSLDRQINPRAAIIEREAQLCGARL